jgi:hypothetical protein
MRVIPLALLALLAVAATAPADAASTRRGAEARPTAATRSQPAGTAGQARVTAATGARSGRTAAQAASRATAGRTAAATQTRSSVRNGIAVGGRGARVTGRRAAVSPGAYEASARQLCPRGGTPRRGGRCRGPAEASLGWQAGLPPPSGSQRDCPEGTMATLARGHDDIVRCMPL